MAIPGAPLLTDLSDVSHSPFLSPAESPAPGQLIFDDLQLEWRGMLFGRRTWMGWQSLKGWDTLPAVDNGAVPRVYQHGSYPGRMRVGDRTVEFQTVSSVGQPEFNALWEEIVKRVIPEDVERPLVIRLNGVTRLAWGRVSAREADVDLSYYMGYPAYTITWTCSDPRRYSVNQKSSAAQPPHAVGGLRWDTGLDWASGLDWGVSQGGTLEVDNDGTVETPLNISFQGPLSAPFYLKTSRWSLGIDYSLQSSELMEIDTLNGTMSVSGVDRSSALTDDSSLIESCTASPGVNQMTFVSSDTSDTGQVAVQWRHADL